MFLGCLFLAGIGWSVVNPVLGKAIVGDSLNPSTRLGARGETPSMPKAPIP